MWVWPQSKTPIKGNKKAFWVPAAETRTLTAREPPSPALTAGWSSRAQPGTYPEGFSGLGGKARGLPSPGTLQDLERCTADSLGWGLPSAGSPSSAERFLGRSLAWGTAEADEGRSRAPEQ